jgi:hypothetical protein
MCAGIRALPSMVNLDYRNVTNVAILRYDGAPVVDPANDPNMNIPMSKLPLNETDLHVSYMCPFFPRL